MLVFDHGIQTVRTNIWHLNINRRKDIYSCKQPATLLYLYFTATRVTPNVLGFIQGPRGKKRGMIEVQNETTLLCSHSLEEQAREDQAEE